MRARVPRIAMVALLGGCCLDPGHDLGGSPTGPACDPLVDEAHCEGRVLVGCARHGSLDSTPSMIGREDCGEGQLCVSDGQGHARCAGPPGTPCDPSTFVARCADDRHVLACVTRLTSHPTPHGAVHAAERSSCESQVCAMFASGPRCVTPAPRPCRSEPPGQDVTYCDGDAVTRCARDASGAWITVAYEDCAHGESCTGTGEDVACALTGSAPCASTDAERCSDDGTGIVACRGGHWRVSACSDGARCATATSTGAPTCVTTR